MSLYILFLASLSWWSATAARKLPVVVTGCSSSSCLPLSSFLGTFTPNVSSRTQRLPFLSIRGGADADGLSSKKKKKKKKSKVKAAEPDGHTKEETKQPTPKKKKQKISKAARAHMTQDIKSNSPNFRIQRELKEFLKDPPPGLSVQVGKNLRVWIVTVEGPGIYKGETFRLRIATISRRSAQCLLFATSFTSVSTHLFSYFPLSPATNDHFSHCRSIFHLNNHCRGPHFYTNGDVCLSLLGKDWRPTMTAQSIALSILSMLASTPKKTMPMDNAQHAGNKPGQYQKDWVYHDDSV